ncbi:hypothetical protein C8039_05760 [Halogeometricum sp. wsp3]|nr:hypothetical protein C8039_05760 [Halogeometricum sp. wsp3]
MSNSSACGPTACADVAQSRKTARRWTGSRVLDVGLDASISDGWIGQRHFMSARQTIWYYRCR